MLSNENWDKIEHTLEVLVPPGGLSPAEKEDMGDFVTAFYYTTT